MMMKVQVSRIAKSVVLITTNQIKETVLVCDVRILHLLMVKNDRDIVDAHKSITEVWRRVVKSARVIKIIQRPQIDIDC